MRGSEFRRKSCAQPNRCYPHPNPLGSRRNPASVHSFSTDKTLYYQQLIPKKFAQIADFSLRESHPGATVFLQQDFFGRRAGRQGLRVRVGWTRSSDRDWQLGKVFGSRTAGEGSFEPEPMIGKALGWNRSGRRQEVARPMQRPRLSTWRFFLFYPLISHTPQTRSGARLPSGPRTPLAASVCIPRLAPVG